jgi:TRAP-type C4-dicarboxylate transport system permease small subunit
MSNVRKCNLGNGDLCNGVVSLTTPGASVRVSVLIPDWEMEKMDTVKLVAFVLIAAGVLALAYGGFTYTKETHEMKIGPIDISVKDKETVNIPIWAGVGAIVIGGLLLVFGGKKP